MSHPSQSANANLSVAVENYFHLSLYFLVATGFATLASTGGLDAFSVLLVTAALLLRGYQLVFHQPWLIPERWTTSLTLVYVGFYLLDYLVLSQQFVASAVHLTLFLLVVRMFSARRDRDHSFLAAIAFVMVLAASILTVDSLVLFCFSIFLLIAVVTFILMEMQRSAAKATVQPRDQEDGKPRRLALSLAGIAPVIVLFTLLGATGIFFLLPRTSAGYLSALAPSGGVATGFSDRVELGTIGEIQQSSSVVMHIQVDGGQGSLRDLRWRGIALRDFDGETWSNSSQPHLVPSFAGNRFDLRSPVERKTPLPRRESRLLTHYRVLMEPIGVNVFFLAPEPKLLAGNYRAVAVDGGRSVFNLDADRAIGVYEAWSVQPAGQAAATVGEPDDLTSYTRLPATDPRISELTSQITAASGTDFEKALAIELYLSTHFAYTLQLPANPPADPVAYFLFERKRGHCEYFASAMAIMLRTLHIPSRVVTGFRGGEFNDLTSQYVVRASQAHAWVEAYFPGRGWVSFDPTPPGLAPTHTGWNRAALYLDAAASFWREWVVNYDAAHRSTLGRDVTRSSLRMAEKTRRWGRFNYRRLTEWARELTGQAAGSPMQWSISGVSIAVFLLLLFNFPYLLRLWREHQLARHPERAPALASSYWYQRMTHQVARRGWRKRPAQTPGEFAQSIPDQALGKRVVEFTRHYEGARFGGSQHDAQQLPELYEEIAARK